MQANVIMSITLVVTALIIIALSIPLLRDRIKMNWVYGARFPKCFESDEAWYKINRYSARRMIIWSFVLIAIAIAGFFIPFTKTDTTAIAFALSPCVYLIAGLETYLYSRRI